MQTCHLKTRSVELSYTRGKAKDRIKVKVGDVGSAVLYVRTHIFNFAPIREKVIKSSSAVSST